MPVLVSTVCRYQLLIQSEVYYFPLKIQNYSYISKIIIKNYYNLFFKKPNAFINDSIIIIYLLHHLNQIH